MRASQILKKEVVGVEGWCFKRNELDCWREESRVVGPASARRLAGLA